MGDCDQVPIRCGSDGLCTYLYFAHVDSGSSGVCVEGVSVNCHLGRQVTCTEAHNLVELYQNPPNREGAYTPTNVPSARSGPPTVPPAPSRPNRRNGRNREFSGAFTPPSMSPQVLRPLYYGETPEEFELPPSRANPWLEFDSMMDAMTITRSAHITRLPERHAAIHLRNQVFRIDTALRFGEIRSHVLWSNAARFSFGAASSIDEETPEIVSAGRESQYTNAAFPFAILGHSVLGFSWPMCNPDSYGQVQVHPFLPRWEVDAVFRVVTQMTSLPTSTLSHDYEAGPSRYVIDTLSSYDMIPLDELNVLIASIATTCSECRVIPAGEDGRQVFGPNCRLECFPEVEYRFVDVRTGGHAMTVQMTGSDYTVDVGNGVFEFLITGAINQEFVIGTNIFHSTVGVFLNQDTIAFCDPL